MGQFSWKTSDTKRAITIWDCEDGSFPVYLVTPDNEKILETLFSLTESVEEE